jgi:lipid-binding SYLF domain-containing protein
MSETSWERTKRYSGSAWDNTKRYSGAAYDKALKPGFDKAWKALDKLGAPINRLSNRVGAEAFWPTSLDKESDKAARILRSFCKDGFYQDIDEAEAKKIQDTDEKPAGPQGKQRVLKKIPESVIKKAKGLAIFTTMRTGLWISGAGGSGILVARNEETGEWSPPSGILLHTAGLGFLVGVDIYDCVIVINTYKALEAFTKIRCTLGGEISAVAGPVGIGGVVDTEVHKRQAPLFTYLKSRGFYAGVQVDGSIVIERADENEVFYGERIGVSDILAGKARNPPKEKYRLLMNTIHAAQGDMVDEKDLPSAAEMTPGDFEIHTDGKFLE